MSSLVNIKLNTIDDVKRFCTLCGTLGRDIALRGEGYRVNASSILGVFSLNLSEKVTLELDDGMLLRYFDEWVV